jgi:hypothetical protein
MIIISQTCRLPKGTADGREVHPGKNGVSAFVPPLALAVASRLGIASGGAKCGTLAGQDGVLEYWNTD